MTLDPDVCYRALSTRDARFDGRFFTAVRSTGVYCRPVCPARTPRRENCWFVACAAAAQEAGFRPCRRCRPEASPGTPAWLGTSATVSRALRLISEGALDRGSVEELAGRLGIGERHLRRLFQEHLGASPLAVAQTRRVLFAKRLLDETALPMTQVALASGFASVRRFNDAMSATYGVPPSQLRRGLRPGKTRDRAADASLLELELPYRPPLHWDALIAFLGRRAIPGVESAKPDAYRRTLRLGSLQGWVEVRPEPHRPLLVARLHLSQPGPLIDVAERLRRIFDLGADPQAIGQQLGADRRLRDALAAQPGVRVPGAWDGFELAVRVILGQQVSVRGASTLAGRLAQRFGDPLPDAGPGGEALGWIFPRAETLAEAPVAEIGIPAARARAISALAAAVASGELALDGTRDPEDTGARLRALPGIGEWSAQAIAMRALGEPDAFPAGDLGLRRALGMAGAPASPRQVERAAEAWRPWRAYAAMLLWTQPA